MILLKIYVHPLTEKYSDQQFLIRDVKYGVLVSETKRQSV